MHEQWRAARPEPDRYLCRPSRWQRRHDGLMAGHDGMKPPVSLQAFAFDDLFKELPFEMPQAVVSVQARPRLLTP
jgi:hypothetical protein